LADDLAANGGQTLTDSTGRTTVDRMGQVGYSAQPWAEGFGVNASNPAEGWSRMLGSAEFCSYVDDPDLVDVGVGISGDVYVVTLGAE
jgi:hypothetical protein